MEAKLAVKTSDLEQAEAKSNELESEKVIHKVTRTDIGQLKLIWAVSVTNIF